MSPASATSAADMGAGAEGQPQEGHFSVQLQEHQPHLMPEPRDRDPERPGANTIPKA